MAATAALVHLLETGDHVISIDDVYGGTQRYFRRTVKPVSLVIILIRNPNSFEHRPTTLTSLSST